MNRLFLGAKIKIIHEYLNRGQRMQPSKQAFSFREETVHGLQGENTVKKGSNSKSTKVYRPRRVLTSHNIRNDKRFFKEI